MKSATKSRTGKRSTARQTSVAYNNAGKGFVVVKSGSNTFILSGETVKESLTLPQTSLFVSVPDDQTSFPVYSSRDIRQAGGIDALSEAIDNNHSIKAPLIEFSEKEWEEIINDLSNDR